jgi:hypothetical protein
METINVWTVGPNEYRTYHEVHPASVSMHRGTVLKHEEATASVSESGITTQNETTVRRQKHV